MAWRTSRRGGEESALKALGLTPAVGTGYVVNRQREQQNVKQFALRAICNSCFALCQLLGLDAEIGGGYLLGDMIPPEQWNPTKKHP